MGWVVVFVFVCVFRFSFSFFGARELWTESEPLRIGLLDLVEVLMTPGCALVEQVCGPLDVGRRASGVGRRASGVGGF
jgi:hypothetical protein